MYIYNVVVIEDGEYNHENNRSVDYQDNKIDGDKEKMEYENTADHVKKYMSRGESSTTFVSVNNTNTNGNEKKKIEV